MNAQLEAGWVDAGWLSLREPADAAARSAELVVYVDQPVVVHDLGAGTGSMARWLAPRLPGPQRWILYDQDADLLRRAAAMTLVAADGAPVTVETRQCDLTRLGAELAGADLITMSALLDLFTAEEVDRVVAACAAAGCPTLATLSVTGKVQLTPADRLDVTVMDAFNAHQRRTVGGRRLLGPNAVDAAAAAFERCGATVRTRPSPWRLGPEHADLTGAWLRGWVGAAREQRPELAAPLTTYESRRLTEAAGGGLEVVVQHSDLLATF